QSDPKMDDLYFDRFSFFTFMTFKSGKVPTGFEDKLTDIYSTYLDPIREPVLKEARHSLEPLTSIHLAESGGPSYLYILGGIALLMMLIASVSYINLAIAQSSKRSKDIGIRKLLGSSRRSLIYNFIGESFAYCALGLVTALLIIYVFLGN